MSLRIDGLQRPNTAQTLQAQAQLTALATASKNLQNPGQGSKSVEQAQDSKPTSGSDATQLGGGGVQEISLPAELDFKTATGETVHLKSSWAKSTGSLYIYNPQANTFALSQPFTVAVYTDKDGNPYILNKSDYDLHYENFASFEIDPKAPKGAEMQIRSIASKIQVVNLTTGKALTEGRPIPSDVAQAAPAPSYWQSFKGWVNEKVDETLGPAYPDGETERYLREIDQAPSTMRYRVARTLQGPIDLPRVLEAPFRLFGMNGDNIRTFAATQASVGGSGSDTLAKGYLLYDQFSRGVWDRTSGGVPHDQSRKLSVDNFMGDVPMILAGLVPKGIQAADMAIATEELWQAQQAARAAAAQWYGVQVPMTAEAEANIASLFRVAGEEHDLRFFANTKPTDENLRILAEQLVAKIEKLKDSQRMFGFINNSAGEQYVPKINEFKSLLERTIDMLKVRGSVDPSAIAKFDLYLATDGELNPALALNSAAGNGKTASSLRAEIAAREDLHPVERLVLQDLGPRDLHLWNDLGKAGPDEIVENLLPKALTRIKEVRGQNALDVLHSLMKNLHKLDAQQEQAALRKILETGVSKFNEEQALLTKALGTKSDVEIAKCLAPDGTPIVKMWHQTILEIRAMFAKN
jgi:hypothetical protein